MPAIFPLFAIVLVFVFITAHSLTQSPQRRDYPFDPKPNRNQKPTSKKLDWTEFLLGVKAAGLATLLVFNLNKTKGTPSTQTTNQAKDDGSVIEFFEFSISKDIIKLAIAYLGLLLINLFPSTAISWVTLTLPIIPISAFAAIRALTSYRIQNGHYGNNRYEALKIIQFIERNSNDKDFPGGPGKKVFLSRKARKRRSFNRLEGKGEVV